MKLSCGFMYTLLSAELFVLTTDMSGAVSYA